MKACWGIEGITPRIIDLGIRWKRSVSFTPWPLYLLGNIAGIQWTEGWVGP